MPRIVKVLISVLIISSLTYLLGWSSVFTVKRVEYSGITNSLQISAVEKKVGNLIGTKLARIEPRQSARSITSLSWVEQAEVSRNWFSSSVTISVKAREAIGALNGRYIDSSGTIFDPVGMSVEVPLLRAPTPAIGLEAAQLFASLPEDFRQSITSMGARSANDFSMEIDAIIQGQSRGLTLRFGNADEIDLKIKVFKALIERKENKNISTVDVSAPHAPIVK
jgi:cell division septal protein FtsQ